MERAEPELERSARRTRWAMPAIGLLVAAGLVGVFGLVGASAREEARGTTGIVFLDGETDQGHPIELMLRDGRPDTVRTSIDAPCAGTPWQTTWIARAGRSARFRFEPPILTVASSWPARFDDPAWVGRHHVALRAELDHGNRVRGHLRLDGTINGPNSSYTCESGFVAFTAVRSG